MSQSKTDDPQNTASSPLSPLPSSDQGPTPQMDDANQDDENQADAAQQQNTAPTPSPAATDDNDAKKDEGAADKVEWMKTLQKDIVEEGLTYDNIKKGIENIANKLGSGSGDGGAGPESNSSQTPDVDDTPTKTL